MTLYNAPTAYISGRIIEFQAFCETIWHYVIFVHEIFQVFL